MRLQTLNEFAAAVVGEEVGRGFIVVCMGFRGVISIDKLVRPLVGHAVSNQIVFARF